MTSLHTFSKNVGAPQHSRGQRVTWSTFQNQNPQISGATVQNVFARATWRPGFVHLGPLDGQNLCCKPYADRPQTRLWYGTLLSQNKDNCTTEFEHKTSTSETPRPPVSALKASPYLDTLLSLLGSLDLHDAVRNKNTKVRLQYMKRESSVDMTRRKELSCGPNIIAIVTEVTFSFSVAWLSAMCHTSVVSRWDGIPKRWMADFWMCVNSHLQSHSTAAKSAQMLDEQFI